jgi:hypothetical protein
MTDDPHKITRRGLFRWAGRGATGLAGAGLVALLARRGQLRATKAECVGKGHCRHCKALADCKLPQGVFQRQAESTPRNEARM